MNSTFRPSTFAKKTTATLAIATCAAAGVGALAITHASAGATPSTHTASSPVASATRTETGTRAQSQTATLRTRTNPGPKPAQNTASAVTGQHPTAQLDPRTATVSKGTNLGRKGAYSSVAGTGVASSSSFSSCDNRVYVNADSMEELAAGNYSVYFRAYVYDFATARWVGSGWYLADGITSIYLTASRPASTVWVQYAKYTTAGWQFNSENIGMSVDLDSGYSVWGC